MKEHSQLEQLERALQTSYRKRLWHPFLLAIRKYRLLEEGDRVAVCISGGKDSMVLAKLMQRLCAHSDFPFSLCFLCMDPGYAPAHRQKIEENARALGIPLEFFETDLFSDAQAAGGEHPCYLCARMRRGWLYSEAKKRGCNKIALGHHQNDVVETVLLSLLYGGQLQGMPPKLRSTSYEGMELIRPLFCVKEENIAAFGRRFGFEFLQCACTVTSKNACGEKGSKRAEVKGLLAELKKTNPTVMQSIFSAIHNVHVDTFAEYKQDGVRHKRFEE